MLSWQRFQRRYFKGLERAACCLLPIPSVDLQHIEKSSKKIARANTRSGHIPPYGKRELINGGLYGLHVVASLTDKPGNKLDVKDPAGAKWTSEELLYTGIDTEDLRSTLRIVDRQAENNGHRGSEYPPEIMAN